MPAPPLVANFVIPVTGDPGTGGIDESQIPGLIIPVTGNVPLIPVTGIETSFNFGGLLGSNMMYNLSMLFFGMAFVMTAASRKKR